MLPVSTFAILCSNVEEICPSPLELHVFTESKSAVMDGDVQYCILWQSKLLEGCFLEELKCLQWFRCMVR